MRYVLIFVVFLGLGSCAIEETPSSVSVIGTSMYFPLEIGHTVEYSVSELVFNEGNATPDSISYDLQEKVVDSFVDDAGRLIYVIDRFRKTSSNNAWVYKQSWQAMITDNQAVRLEDNRRFIKLLLPTQTNDQWDGNALFDDSAPLTIGNDPIDYYKEWGSKVVSTNHQETLNGVTYDNVHTILLADHENRLELRFGKEMYSKGIGLIYRELRILDTQCFDNCEGMPWERKAENGHIYIQSILNN